MAMFTDGAGYRNDTLSQVHRFGSRRRPCVRLARVTALALVLHALVLVNAWHTPVRTDPKPATRISMRWLQATAAQPAVRTTNVAARATVRPRARAALPAGPRLAPAALAPATPVRAEAVVGVAWGLPRLGFAAGGPARWMRPPAAEAAPQAPAPQLIAQTMQAQAARAAGHTRIAEALHSALDSAQADTDEGSCALGVEPHARLICDNDALTQALASREARLSELLRAYRSVEPHTKGLSIAMVQGRYQVSWDMGANTH